MDKISAMAALAILAVPVFAQDIFQQQKQSTMGNGHSNTTQSQVQTQTQQNAACAQLRAERDALNKITEKQQWIPIEQQNANYYRYQQIRRDMSAMGCAY